MRSSLAIGFVVVLAIAAVLARAEDVAPAPGGGGTLLGTLAEWQYPGAAFGGASMSDGGNRAAPSVNCQAVLTTDDPVEKVAKFYTEKFVAGPAEPDLAVGPSGAQSVAEQDDSTGRPLQIRVIVVTRAASSTTLVISRADGEQRTHIAWSQHLRLSVAP